MLVLTLGNPGIRYENTRHNVGFRVADRIAAERKASFRKRFLTPYHSCSIREGEDRIHLVKPLTYVNNSGVAASRALKAFRVDIPHMLVVCDNLDLDPGVCRIKKGGKDAGHNGLKSIIRETGSGDFLRLYLGIGHPGRQGGVVDWVLGEPDAGENELINEAVAKAAAAIQALINHELEQVMNELNRKR